METCAYAHNMYILACAWFPKELTMLKLHKSTPVDIYSYFVTFLKKSIESVPKQNGFAFPSVSLDTQSTNTPELILIQLKYKIG